MTRKKFENVQIKFSVMSQITLKYADMIDPKRMYNASNSPEDVLDNLAKLSWLRTQTTFMGIEPEEFNKTLQFQGTDCRMMIVDCANVLESLTGRESIQDPRTGSESKFSATDYS